MNVDQISKDLKKVKPSKNLSVFLVCLLIAFLFWMLNAFTKSYSTVIEIPIEYINIPSDKVSTIALPDKASAEVSGSGFRLLSISFFDSPEPILVDFDLGNKQVGFKKLVSSFGPEFLRSQVLNDIPSELSLGSLSIDSLKVIVEDKGSKKLRIGANLDMNIEYPFFLNGKIDISPSHITILGANSLVQNLDSVSTELIKLGNIQENTNKEIALLFPTGIESEIVEVTITIPIDEYTEGEIDVPISILNLPNKKALILLPSSISVTYLVGLSKYDKVKKEDFNFSVDASMIEKGKPVLIVTLNSNPEFIQVQDYSPHKVEYILKK